MDQALHHARSFRRQASLWSAALRAALDSPGRGRSPRFLLPAFLLFTASRATASASVPGLSEAIDPAVTTGTVVHIIGPPAVVPDGSNPEGDSVATATPIMEARKGPGSLYQQLKPNWLTELHPSVSLSQIGSLIQQRYDTQVMNRVNAPAVTGITVEHMTLIYPAGYYFNVDPVTVHTRRLVLHSSDRFLTAYFLNYDKVTDYGGAVLFQINGHFGNQPSRIGIGLKDRGGLMAAALGKIAMQALPLITYDDHNVGESSNGVASNLPRTLENIVQMDQTLLTQFSAVDAFGLSGGTERAYHLMGLFQSNVRSAYCSGWCNPLWTQYTSVNDPNETFFGFNADTYDDTLFGNFQTSDMMLLGMSRGVRMAFAHAARESGIGKYGYHVEMVPALMMYTNTVETRGDDANGDGVPDYGGGLNHEYNLPDFFEWLGVPIPTSSIPSHVDRILLVDAAEPGADPAVTWEDLSPSGYDFTNTTGVTHVDAPGVDDDRFSLGSSDRFEGIGDETMFDFDTDIALGTGLGTPFSINVYLKQTWSFDTTRLLMISKTDEPGNGQFAGWFLAGNPDSPTTFDFNFQPGNNVNRMFARTGGGVSGSRMMLTVTHDGTGLVGGTQWYVNGALLGVNAVADGLGGSIRTDFPLVIGAAAALAGPTGFRGELYFLEIFRGVLSADDVAARWNGGTPLRGSSALTLSTVPVDAFAIGEMTGFQFASDTGRTYHLMSTTDLVTSSNWERTGAFIDGDGTSLLLFDPTGYSTQKAYRVEY